MRISDWSSDVCSSDLLPLPALGPKDVRIKVHAAGLNFPDTLMIAGKYQVKPAFPFAPGMECAGVIDAVGDKVTEVAPGDRVMATTGNGAFGEQIGRADV